MGNTEGKSATARGYHVTLSPALLHGGSPSAVGCQLGVSLHSVPTCNGDRIIAIRLLFNMSDVKKCLTLCTCKLDKVQLRNHLLLNSEGDIKRYCRQAVLSYYIKPRMECRILHVGHIEFQWLGETGVSSEVQMVLG